MKLGVRISLAILIIVKYFYGVIYIQSYFSQMDMCIKYHNSDIGDVIFVVGFFFEKKMCLL